MTETIMVSMILANLTNYDIAQPNLVGIGDRLKKMKKSRFTDTDPIVTYGDLGEKRVKEPNVGDEMWNVYENTKFGDKYQIGRKNRDRNSKEIQEKRNDALQTYDWLDKDQNLNKSDKKCRT
jgi:hypothetical protein